MEEFHFKIGKFIFALEESSGSLNLIALISGFENAGNREGGGSEFGK